MSLSFTAPLSPGFAPLATPEALGFVGQLVSRFAARRDALLEKRTARQVQLDAGILPDFLPHTQSIRSGDWRVTTIPDVLQDRRVEITGPIERKMMINALNSGAHVFMADCEDSLSPTWAAIMQGQVNLRDYASGTLTYTSPDGKEYKLNDKTAVLIFRPRGWHLPEKHVLYGGAPIPAALFDFGLYIYHNSFAFIKRGFGPYFYLPKLESAEEAQLWADIFVFTEESLSLQKSTIKATVLIETILAAFEMDEILYALKDYCIGLNCGRWDYIFSFIKKLHKHKAFVLPDRAQVTMTSPFLRAYSQLLIQTCHKRGAFAMGGMSASIPVKGDDTANDHAYVMVRADKEREARDGHDGTWVAHPALVPVAREVFDRLMPTPNQITLPREPVNITQQDLLSIPKGTITESGLRSNISVSVQYSAAWLSGLGCVPLFNIMEDAATAEIARSQLWQWIHHAASLADGRIVTLALYQQLLAEELAKLPPSSLPYAQAAQGLSEMVASPTFTDFLTLAGYYKLA